MLGGSIIHNGRLESAPSAVVPVDDPDAFHGYGCYETLRIRDGILYFPEFHEERLLRSAALLEIRHELKPGDLTLALHRLVAANGLADCNAKVLLFGRDGKAAEWFAFLLPALYPPEDSALAGVSCTLFYGERPLPAAKSLGVLVSTLAFRQARARSCWDALLVNRRGEITEGTRTNLFYVRATGSGPLTVYSPPSADALEGVTRRTLLEALSASGVTVVERVLPAREVLSGRYCLMLTSTSTGIVPVRTVLDTGGAPHQLPASPAFEQIRGAYLKRVEEYTRSGRDA